MNTWFRLYHEVLDDPKVQRLPAPLFKTWINFMCLQSRHGGTLPPVPDIAFGLRVSEEKALKLVAELMDAGLIEKHADGELGMHNWRARQFQSDGSTERVKRFRAKHGNVSVGVTRNVPETANATLPDTDTEQRQIQNQEGSLLQDSSKLQIGSSIHVLSTAQKPPSTAFDPMAEFQPRWDRYPNKDGRKDAERHWKASIRTPADVASFDRALDLYIEHLRVTGYAPKNGKTFFNNWQDFVEWIEPPRSTLNGNGAEKETYGARIARTNQETRTRIRQRLHAATGDGVESGDSGGADRSVHPRLIGSE